MGVCGEAMINGILVDLLNCLHFCGVISVTFRVQHQPMRVVGVAVLLYLLCEVVLLKATTSFNVNVAMLSEVKSIKGNVFERVLEDKPGVFARVLSFCQHSH